MEGMLTTARRLAVPAVWVWVLLVGVSDFKRVRIELPIGSRPQANTQVVDLSNAAQVPSTKLLVTIGITNQSPNQALTISTDKGGANTLVVAPSSDGRLQLAYDNEPGTSGQLTLIGNHAEWKPASMVVSNARGFSRGVISFAVVPRHQNAPGAPVWIWILSLAAALIVLRRDEPISNATWRVLLLVGAWGSVALFLTTAVSGLASPFQIVLEPRSYLLGLVLCVAGFGAPSSVLRFIRRPIGTSLLVRGVSGLAGLIFFGAVMLQALASYGGNYSGFLHVTRQVAERAPFLTERPDLRGSLVLLENGYDAQFMYLMAFDPLMQRYADEPVRYREVVDHPPYRFARIGFSALTNVFAAGTPERFPATMLWLILAGHLLLGLGLVGIAAHSGAPPWIAAAYLVIPGYLASLTFGLPEALAGAGLILGTYWLLSGRSALAASGFAASLLVRETGLFLVVAAIYSLGQFNLKERARLLGFSLVPVVGWRLFVGVRLYRDWGWMGFLPSPGDFVPPFTGFAQLISAVLDNTHPQSEAEAAVLYPILLTVGSLVAVIALFRTRSALAGATCAYAAVAVSLNYDKIWMHVPSGERGTIELFLSLLLLAIIYYKDDSLLSRRILWLWPALAIYTFLVSPEAGVARAGLLLIR
jgi:hypothetical protein